MAYPTTNELRDKITFYTLTKTLDEYGQTAMSYTVYRSLVPAKVRTKSSREDNMNDKRVSTYEYEIYVRHNQGFSTDMIIGFNGSYLSIYGIEDVDGKRRMDKIKAYYNEDNQGIIE